MSDRASRGQAKRYLLIAVISLAGLADAIFLTVEHLTGATLSCVVSTGCSEVLASRYSMVGSVPMAALGAGAYFLMFSAAILAAFEYRWAGNFLLLLAGPMLGTTLWLVYVQAFVLHAFCDYCLLSAAITLVLVTLIAAQHISGSSATTGG